MVTMFSFYRCIINTKNGNTISYMSAIDIEVRRSRSPWKVKSRLHSEFVRLIFLQGHRETDRFFATSGVQVTPHDSTSPTSVSRRFPHRLNPKSDWPLPDLNLYVFHLTYTGHLSHLHPTLTLSIHNKQKYTNSHIFLCNRCVL